MGESLTFTSLVYPLLAFPAWRHVCVAAADSGFQTKLDADMQLLFNKSALSRRRPRSGALLKKDSPTAKTMTAIGKQKT